MKLIAFNYGRTEITEKMAFVGGDDSVKLPIGLLFFLIEDGDRRILVDVGCDTMPGFELFEFEMPVRVLESYGIRREDITDVIITHSHHDHIDAVYNYPQATVYIHKSELESAQRYLTSTPDVIAFDDSLKIIDGVEVRHMGGHSIGSSIVLIYAHRHTYVLCGDECYTKENLTENKPTGSSFCPERSRAFVEEYRQPRYIPILFHDSDIVSGIGYKSLFENRR